MHAKRWLWTVSSTWKITVFAELWKFSLIMWNTMRLNFCSWYASAFFVSLPLLKYKTKSREIMSRVTTHLDSIYLLNNIFFTLAGISLEQKLQNKTRYDATSLSCLSKRMCVATIQVEKIFVTIFKSVKKLPI